jgi:hypothetical protein
MSVDTKTDQKPDQLSTADLAKTPNARTVETDNRPSREPAREREAEAAARTDDSAPLFAAEEAQQLRGRWDAIQTAFVDEPRRAVENADELVASAMKRLAEIFAQERETLEHQWDRGEQISTEDLRVAFQRYRSFFTRILRV